MRAALAVEDRLAVAGGDGAGGLAPVPTDQWGGLPLTILLSTLSLVAAFAVVEDPDYLKRQRAELSSLGLAPTGR